MKKFILIFLFSFLIFTLAINKGQAFVEPVAYQALNVIDGAGLYTTQLPNENQAYLQVIDLRKMQIDQIVGEVDEMGFNQGLYYRGEGNYYSPFFQRKPFSDVWNEYKTLYGGQVFSLINCSFFEHYKPQTQLSFPIKLNGQVITGGRSGFGPIRNPANPIYKTIRLKALVWDENSAYITDYEPVSGFPLSKPTVKNAVVSYRYSDHTPKLIGSNKPNKYHLIGTLDKDGIVGDELILILTVNKATLDEAADLLRQLGVRGEIITLDGGSSTLLTNSQTGDLITPTVSKIPNDLPDNISTETIQVRQLPHYLGFRQKGESKEPPQIIINQPSNPIQINPKLPYLILWRGNVAKEVKVELYQGSGQVKDIASRKASDGVVEWIPDTPILPNSVVQVRSLENQNVFGKIEIPGGDAAKL